MRFGFGTLGVILFVLSLGGSAAAAPGTTESPVAFVSGEPLLASCADLAGAGVRIPIRNETATKQRVRFAFELTRNNGRTVKAKSVCGGLKLLPARRSLAPGAGAAVTLTGSNAMRKGIFAGSLAIYGRRGRVARRDLTISSAPTPVAGLEATPLVASVKTTLHPTEKGPLWVPVEGPSTSLPPAQPEEEGEAVTVGALSGPDGPVAVVYNGGGKSLGTDASRVELELDGDLSIGTYSGQVDLAPEDDEKGPVSLEVEVTQDWWWAALALLVGIYLGILLLRISGRTVPKARLLGRVAGLSRRHKDVTDGLSSIDAGTKSWNHIRIADLGRLQQQRRDQIREATKRWKVLVKIEKSVIDNIEAAIAAVEAQIDLLKEVPKHARPLEAALLQPRAAHLPSAPKSGAGQGKPRLDAEGGALLASGGIAAEDLKPRLEQMDVRMKQIGMLRRLERRLEKVWLDRQALGPDADPKALRKVDEALEGSMHQLWEANDEEGLQEAGTQISATADALLAVPSKPPAAPAPARPGLVQTLRMRASSLGADKVESDQKRAEALVAAREEPVSTPAAPEAAVQPAAAPPIPPSPPAPQLTEEDAEKAIWRALKIQVFVVLAAAGLAVATGLGALYVGETWGTAWDVIAAIVWGTAAQAVVTTLVTSLDDLGALASLGRR